MAPALCELALQVPRIRPGPGGDAVLIDRHLGVWASMRSPSWKKEGYCDYVAGDTTFPIPEAKRLIRAGQIRSGGQDVQMLELHRPEPRFGDRRGPQQHVVGGPIELRARDSDSARGVSLWVAIDQERPLPLLCVRHRQVGRGSRFSLGRRGAGYEQGADSPVEIREQDGIAQGTNRLFKAA